MRALVSRPHGCFSSYLIAKPIWRGWGASSEPEMPHSAATSPAYLNLKRGEEAFCYSSLEANGSKAEFHFILTTKILFRHHGPEWIVSVLKARTVNAVLAVAAMALRLLTCCEASPGKGSVPRGSNFTLWQSNYMEFTYNGDFYLWAGQVQLQCNSFHICMDSTCERRKNWIINIQVESVNFPLLF